MTEAGSPASAPQHPVAAASAALRARGAHGFDPVRFCFIEALERRAAAHDGETRRRLEGRVAALLSDYQARLDSARTEADVLLEGTVGRFPESADDLKRLHAAADFSGLARRSAALEREVGRPSLRSLVHLLDQHAAQHGPAAATARPGSPAARQPGELKTLSYFRSTWAKLSVDLRLTPSLAKVPENAGPLNSHALALRTLKLMRDIAPAYLDHFVAYADALSWLEQAQAGGLAAAQKETVRRDADKPRKAARKPAG